MSKNTILWKDRKRPFLGLPLSFTVYTLTDEKLMVRTGFLSQQEEEVRLYRILDITLKRSIWQRLFGIGTIVCCSADKSTPTFEISHIKDPRRVKELLSDAVENNRDRKGVISREYMDEDVEPEDIGEDEIPLGRNQGVRIHPGDK